MYMKSLIAGVVAAVFAQGAVAEKGMDKMWGESVVKLRAEDAERGQLFEQGNYAMFIHWGLYSQLETRWTARPTMASANGS